MDREIGSRFYNRYVGKLEVVEGISCQSCVFFGEGKFDLPFCLTEEIRSNVGNCTAAERTDGKSIVFIKVEEQ